MEKNELNKNAKGGTELMQERIERGCDQSLLQHFQIVHSRVRNLDPKRKKILVLHDLAQDPEVQHLKDGGWKKFDKLVFVSHWQQQMYNLILGVPYSAGVVLRNAIEPIPDHQKPTDKIRLIYYSTPHRGLDLLYAVFNQLAKEHENIELNVFSSFQLYGWPQRDEPFKELFQKLSEHPQINYHKSVNNERIREEIQRSHIFAYPSTWQETSCLCLIEAMSGKLVSVHSSLAALPETSMGLTQMYGYNEDRQAHANRFYQELKGVILAFEDPNQKSIIAQRTANDKYAADTVYDWNYRKLQWNALMKTLLTQT